MGRRNAGRNGYDQFNGEGWFIDDIKGKGQYTEAKARIDEPYFGLVGRDGSQIGLHFELSTENYGCSISWWMTNLKDVEEFLRRTGARRVEDLDDTVIVIYRSKPLTVVGIGINEHLIPKRS